MAGDNLSLPFSLHLPTKIRFVPGRAEEPLEEICSAGIKNLAVLVDANISNLQDIANFLGKVDEILGISIIVEYAGGEPTYAELEKYRPMFPKGKSGGVLAIGGGSTIDVGKAMAVLATNHGPALSYRGFDKPKSPSLPIITVPTVAGSGSEITPNASFVDDQEMRKMGINGECVRPCFAIIDPAFSISCPRKPTLSAAADSMVHSTEAYLARNGNPISRLLAREAFSLVFSNLEQAIANPENIECRCSLHLGALCATFAIMHSGTGPPAAMSYPMGVRYEVPHGFAGAIFLPVVASITKKNGCSLHDELMTFLNSNASYSEEVSALWKRIDIPSSLDTLGIPVEGEEIIVQDTLELGAALEQHPTHFGKGEIEEALRRLRSS